MGINKFFVDIKNTMMRNYGENPGKMLVHTGTLGWILSSLAQITAIVFNDKIPKDQKTFLILQEAADGGINIASFYLITNTFTNIANKFVSTGKFRTAAVDKFLKKHNLQQHIGSLDFNIKELANYNEIKDSYAPMAAGVSIAASTLGSILSCNIVTPVLRNKYAALKQKELLAKNEIAETNALKSPRGISMATFQYNASINSRNGMRV